MGCFFEITAREPLKLIIIAELCIVMTISPGQLRRNNSDNAEKCSFTIIPPYASSFFTIV